MRRVGISRHRCGQTKREYLVELVGLLQEAELTVDMIQNRP